MKILHLFKMYFPETQGGVEETIRQICMSTAALGAENYVFTLGPGKEAEVISHDNATVMRYPRNIEIASTGISLQALSHFRQVAMEMDVIHYHFPWPFADVMHLMNRINRPSILTYHSDIVRQKVLAFFYRPLMKCFMGHMDMIVATSPNYVQTSPVLKKLDRLTVIPIGIDQKSYPTCEHAIQQKLISRVGKDFFLFVGVMRYYKGLHILLDAIKGTTLPVVIAGAGPIEHELKAKKKAYGLKNVVFLGRVSNQQRTALYDLCRAVVFPSHMRSEAFGLTLVEGAMHAKPLISTEIGTGTSYINIDGETGLVIEPGRPQALREAMLLLHQKPEISRQLGVNARHRYEQMFTAKQMGHAYWHVYNNVVQQKK